jgi:Ca-activated chloride channel family protein
MSVARIIMMMVLLCMAAGAGAQERSLVRKGNELYVQKKYAEAAAAYQQALQKQPQFVPGAFNLGNALIQQKQYDAARKAMEQTVRTTKSPAIQGGAQYNTGNTYMSEQQWQQAVDAYKKSLRKAPQDSDAKYNLSYALAKLKQQQNKDKKDQDKKDQQQKPDQQKKKGADKKDQQQQPQQEKGDQKEQQRQQPQPGTLTEQQADNLLKALQQDERKVQDKMQQSKAPPVKMEKDW